MIAELVVWAYGQGYKVRWGDNFRDPRVHGQVGEKQGYGRANSCHKYKLAADLNLFKDGEFIKTTEGHRPLGEKWQSMGGSWGGDFNDANHYSLEHNGYR